MFNEKDEHGEWLGLKVSHVDKYAPRTTGVYNVELSTLDTKQRDQ